MIGIWKSYSDIYLYVVGAAMLVTFGLPLLLVPLRWAQVFRWEIPKSEHLVVMLGRSLGLVISLIAIFAFKAAGVPAVQPFFFNFLLWLLVTETLLHIYGAIRKAQPITETIEITLWVALLVLTLCFYPA